jgi:hypothetical protein
MDEINQPLSRRGLNWGGCLAFIVIFAIGVFMILPMLRFEVQGKAKGNYCGKYQAQIVGALVAYSVNEGVAWPDPRGDKVAWKLAAGPITSALEAAKCTAGVFELLAASQTIPNSLFKCPSSTFGGPNKQMKPSVSETTVNWGWDPANGVAVSYAFDWAAPADPSSQRVVGADRDIKAHKDAVMAVFGDAHVTKLKLVPVTMRAPGSLVTVGVIVDPINVGAFSQEGDDIYSNEGDANDGLTPDKGDPLRAWVK